MKIAGTTYDINKVKKMGRSKFVKAHKHIKNIEYHADQIFGKKKPVVNFDKEE